MAFKDTGTTHNCEHANESHAWTCTHLCKQLTPLAVRPVPCFDIGDTVLIMTFIFEWLVTGPVRPLPLCLSSDCQTGSTKCFGFLIKQDAILSHDLVQGTHAQGEEGHRLEISLNNCPVLPDALRERTSWWSPTCCPAAALLSLIQEGFFGKSCSANVRAAQNRARLW